MGGVHDLESGQIARLALGCDIESMVDISCVCNCTGSLCAFVVVYLLTQSFVGLGDCPEGMSALQHCNYICCLDGIHNCPVVCMFATSLAIALRSFLFLPRSGCGPDGS